MPSEASFILYCPLANTQKVIDDPHVPLQQLGAKAGEDLLVRGDIKFASDQPPLCFKKTFKKDSKTKIDYFSCSDCKKNWICPACADHCHRRKGHNVRPYLLQHIPTWACCYCL